MFQNFLFIYSLIVGYAFYKNPSYFLDDFSATTFSDLLKAFPVGVAFGYLREWIEELDEETRLNPIKFHIIITEWGLMTYYIIKI